MATTIKASCPTCGDVHLTDNEVRLMVCTEKTMSYYAFDCPGCRREIRKSADEHVVSLLLSGGIAPTLWSVPAEAMEPTRVSVAAAFTSDDVLDFAMALADDDALNEALRQLV